jgi:RimJ/RimL family protein N-acetyltransferase
MELLVGFAFSRLNLRKLLCEVVEPNPAALALYERLGFVEEGRLRRQAFRGGSYRDVLLLALERPT